VGWDKGRVPHFLNEFIHSIGLIIKSPSVLNVNVKLLLVPVKETVIKINGDLNKNLLHPWLNSSSKPLFYFG
jgi:hypothetical protein